MGKENSMAVIFEGHETEDDNSDRNGHRTKRKKG